MDLSATILHPRHSRWTRRKVGLFGGSFNPVHQGHLLMSKQALHLLGLDCIWWIVTPKNPLKDGTGLKDYDDRLSRARAFSSDHFRYDQLIVTDVEQHGNLQYTNLQYTWQTLRFLKRNHPITKFIWIMGADNWQQFHRWRNWRRIARMMPLAIVARPGYGHYNSKASLFFRIYAPVHARNWKQWRPPAAVILRQEQSHLSSTLIRSREKIDCESL